MAVRSFTTKVISREVLTPKVLKFEFNMPDGGLEYKAGQFASIVVAKNIRRSYSFASLDTDQSKFDLIVDIAPGGPGSVYFDKLQVGDEMSCLAPLGNFIYRAEEDYPVHFYATGTGIAPLWVMILDALKTTKREVKLFLGFRFEDEIFYRSEIEQLAQKYPNFSYDIFISRPTDKWTGRTGYVNQDIPNLKTNVDAYICGGNHMIVDTTEKLKAVGIPAGQIYSEQYY